MEEQHIIKYNVLLLKWYFKKNKNILDEKEKEYIFNLMTYSFLEDSYCFMRIMLYIAHTRNNDEKEIAYKIMVHFLGTMFPEIVLANLDMFVKLGKKNDVLYFVQIPSISQRVGKWIKHIAKSEPIFNNLLNGKLINEPRELNIYYQPKWNNKNKWTILINKILDETLFNGITLPSTNIIDNK